MKRISVLIAEDHTIVCEGIRLLLGQEADLDVVGVARDGRQAVALAISHRPDVVLMDIAMPRLNGIDAAQQVLKALPSTRLLMLSAHSEEAYILRAKEVGAAGFLFKQTTANQAARAIREVHEGRTFFASPRPGGAGHGHGQGWQDLRKLTPREREVLQLVAEGKANKECAAELGISVKTVEKHREHLMAKLGIHDTAGLTRHAIGAGIIEGGVQFTLT